MIGDEVSEVRLDEVLGEVLGEVGRKRCLGVFPPRLAALRAPLHLATSPVGSLRRARRCTPRAKPEGGGKTPKHLLLITSRINL